MRQKTAQLRLCCLKVKRHFFDPVRVVERKHPVVWAGESVDEYHRDLLHFGQMEVVFGHVNVLELYFSGLPTPKIKAGVEPLERGVWSSSRHLVSQTTLYSLTLTAYSVTRSKKYARQSTNCELDPFFAFLPLYRRFCLLVPSLRLRQKRRRPLKRGHLPPGNSF